MRDQYLERYAEPETRFERPAGVYDHVIVVPAFNEAADTTLSTWANVEGNFLIVLVVNSPEPGHAQTQQLFRHVLASGEPRKLSEHVTMVSGEIDILVVDRFSEGREIPPRQGVGLARKIGADIALQLISDGVIHSRKIHLTDADATLPASYFDVPVSDTATDAAAFVRGFRHVAGDVLAEASLIYDIHMLYYVAGLRWAGSPYGYTTIGSTISCDADAYAKVRGCPKRNTGEDFYLLNKLRKVGPVQLLGDSIITLQARASERVPIGTGQALVAINELGNPAQDYPFYHPDVFTALATALAAIQSGHVDRQAPHAEIVMNYCETTELGAVLKQRRARTETAVLKHRHDWFDGLRTLQFVHHMRDVHFGTVPASSITSAPFVSKDVSDLEGLREQLYRLAFRG